MTVIELVLERWRMTTKATARAWVHRSPLPDYAARHGLSEAELSDLLGENGKTGAAATWAPFSLAAEPFLVVSAADS